MGVVDVVPPRGVFLAHGGLRCVCAWIAVVRSGADTSQLPGRRPATGGGDAAWRHHNSPSSGFASLLVWVAAKCQDAATTLAIEFCSRTSRDGCALGAGRVRPFSPRLRRMFVIFAARAPPRLALRAGVERGPRCAASKLRGGNFTGFDLCACVSARVAVVFLR